MSRAQAISSLVEALVGLGIADEVRQELVSYSEDSPPESGTFERISQVVRQEMAALRAEICENMTGGEQWISVKEASRLAETSPKTIRRWIVAGKLEATKPGSEWRIRRSELEVCMTRNADGGGRVDVEGEAARILEMSRHRKR